MTWFERHFGGAYEQIITEDATLAVCGPTRGRLQRIWAEDAGLNVTLPSPSGLTSGGPWFKVASEGTHSFTLRHPDETDMRVLDSGESADVILYDGQWYSFVSQKNTARPFYAQSRGTICPTEDEYVDPEGGSGGTDPEPEPEPTTECAHYDTSIEIPVLVEHPGNNCGEGAVEEAEGTMVFIGSGVWRYSFATNGDVSLRCGGSGWEVDLGNNSCNSTGWHSVALRDVNGIPTGSITIPMENTSTFSSDADATITFNGG